MATSNITTWDDIRSKAAGATETLTLYLQNDIDLNNEYPYGVSTVTIGLNIGYYLTSGTWTLNGDDGSGGRYKIRNLRTLITTPQSIFNVNNTENPNMKIVFKNIDFVNLILSGADFFTNGGFTGSIEFINCRFVGCRTGNAYLINKKTRITCTSCYFDMPWYGYDSTAYDYTSLIASLTTSEVGGGNLPQANYCWFHETYGGWRITASSSGGWNQSNLVTTSCRAFCMNGCYVDGTMTVSGDYDTTNRSYCYCYVSNYALIATNAWTSVYTPNVIEIMWKVSSSVASNYSMYPYTHKLACVFRKWLYRDSTLIDDTITWNIISDSASATMPAALQATSAQMQDVSWLQSKGFPIIPTTT